MKKQQKYVIASATKQSIGYFILAIIYFALIPHKLNAQCNGSGVANTANCTWTAPFQVTAVTVECWGAGGGGSADDGADGGGGGGGGAYAKSVLAVTPGVNTYYIGIGTGGTGKTNNEVGGVGGNSWFNLTVNSAPGSSAAGVLAKGGSGAAAGGGGGAGGTTASSYYNTTAAAGGAGGAGGDNAGGGGGEAGGAGGTGDVGNSGDAGANGGSGVNNPGGDGGNGIAGDGVAGNVPGGGGGGGGNNGGSDYGGNGGGGQVTLTWSTCTNACAQPTSFVASNIGTTTMTLSWARGGGTGGVLIVAGTSAITDPTANISAADAAYGSAPVAGNGKAVYDGTGTSVNITGLTEGVTYYFAAYEFNTGRCYNLSGETTVSAATCSTPGTQATTFSRSNEAATTMTLNWTRGNGSKVLVLARATSAVATDPTNGVTYTANAAYGSGTAIGSAYVVYDGTGTSVDLTALTSGTTYHFAAYEYNTPTACYNLTELTGNYCNKPVTPGSVTGTAAQCKNTTGQTYSVAAVTGAASYTWTVPTNWSITAGGTTNSITVTTSVNAADNGNITVTANNACGSSAAATLAVTLDVPAQTSTLNSN